MTATGTIDIKSILQNKAHEIFDNLIVQKTDKNKTKKSVNTLKKLYGSVKFAAIIQEVLDMIENDLFNICFVLEEKKEKIAKEEIYKETIVKKELCKEIYENNKRPVYQRDLLKCYKNFKEQLISFAKRSTVTAAFVKKIFEDKYVSFAFAPEPVWNDITEPKYTDAEYEPNLKAIIIPINIKFDPAKFQDLLTQECVHAMDDILMPDSETENTRWLSLSALKKEIMPMFINQRQKNKTLFSMLKKMRNKKRFKNDPVFRVDKTSRKELDLVKATTWCWSESNKDPRKIAVHFIAYMEINDSRDDDLILEYIAYGLTFFLSNDISKRKRLSDMDPAFFCYIRDRLIPILTGQIKVS